MTLPALYLVVAVKEVELKAVPRHCEYSCDLAFILTVRSKFDDAKKLFTKAASRWTKKFKGPLAVTGVNEAA
jgi:hypothetical protein